jgi:hypothetical protein
LHAAGVQRAGDAAEVRVDVLTLPVRGEVTFGLLQFTVLSA